VTNRRRLWSGTPSSGGLSIDCDFPCVIKRLIFLARRLLVCLIDYPLSPFINRGAHLDLSLQANETITIHGVLVPVSWNTSGEIVRVAVSTFDEKEYRIADDDAAGRWRDYLNREVAIQGRPFRNGIEQWITVLSFQVIQSAPNMESNIR
jgi:hypothetical protein